MAKYTFLLPAYKAKYLKDAIDSILAQEFVDFAVIVSDDCSPENIKSVINGYNDKRLSYRCNNENIGGLNLVNHWNNLLDICESDYLIMASDDDIYSPKFLTQIEVLANKYPTVDVFRSRVCRIDNNGEVTAEDDLYEELLNPGNVAYTAFCTNYIGCIGNYVFKTSALRKLGGFTFFQYAWFSDLATVLNMSANGMGSTADVLFSFRLSEANISNTNHTKNVERGKLQATLNYNWWLNGYFDGLDSTSDKLVSNRHAKSLKNAKAVVYAHIGDYSWAISILELFKVYSQIKKDPKFSKVSFLKNYFMAVLARKITKYV